MHLKHEEFGQPDYDSNDHRHLSIKGFAPSSAIEKDYFSTVLAENENEKHYEEELPTESYFKDNYGDQYSDNYENLSYDPKVSQGTSYDNTELYRNGSVNDIYVSGKELNNSSAVYNSKNLHNDNRNHISKETANRATQCYTPNDYRGTEHDIAPKNMTNNTYDQNLSNGNTFNEREHENTSSSTNNQTNIQYESKITNTDVDREKTNATSQEPKTVTKSTQYHDQDIPINDITYNSQETKAINGINHEVMIHNSNPNRNIDEFEITNQQIQSSDSPNKSYNQNNNFPDSQVMKSVVIINLIFNSAWDESSSQQYQITKYRALEHNVM